MKRFKITEIFQSEKPRKNIQHKKKEKHMLPGVIRTEDYYFFKIIFFLHRNKLKNNRKIFEEYFFFLI